MKAYKRQIKFISKEAKAVKQESQPPVHKPAPSIDAAKDARINFMRNIVATSRARN